jgi:signal transduction histidine kinase
MSVHNARLCRRSQHALEEAMRHRDEVLGVVAHDLKNPLGAVQMYAFLLAESPLSERDRKIVEGITRAVGQMDRLIRDLLEVSRIEAGSLVLEREAVQAGALVWEALQAAAANAEHRGIALKAKVPEDEARVNADRHRLRQVFDNLIGNALKFTPAGGAITVRAETGDDEVCFSVVDTGPGIAPEDLPHLFDRFYQARHTRKEGAGLGLSIVKGIVEAHGGRVSVESTPGSGATFRFTLPALPRGSAMAGAPEPSIVAAGVRP